MYYVYPPFFLMVSKHDIETLQTNNYTIQELFVLGSTRTVNDDPAISFQYFCPEANISQ